MALGETVLMDFDQEMANTRNTLERVPVEKSDWKPHEKSMTLGRLARLVADLAGWSTITIEKDSLDFAPPGEPYQPQPPPLPKSRQELLELFDRNVFSARKAITGSSDEHLKKTWSLLSGGKTIFTLPRITVLRTTMNHLIHYRAQLGVYLGLNGVPVPALYGPSADEGQM